MKKEDFEQLVNLSMENADFANMRPVVEKELLHYEIFSALDEAGLLKNLVFQGGTSLRLCRGSDRFSEDLGFAGGKNFSSVSMEKIKACIQPWIRIGPPLLYGFAPPATPAVIGNRGRLSCDC
jgi:hypothetical protein